MATFEIQGPDGATYEIEAPDEAAALSAFSRFSKTSQGQFEPPATGGRPSPLDRFEGPSRRDRGHNAPSFDPGVEGYNAETGMVEHTGMMDKVGAFSTGGVGGVPIVGPGLLNAAQAAAAGIVAPFSEQDFGEIYDQLGNRVEQVQEDNPNTALAGHLTGAVVGTMPLIRALPAAFGVGTGNLAVRSGQSLLGGTAIGGADSAVRSGGDAEAVRRGIIAGGVSGAAGPALGAALGAGYRGASEWLANTRIGDLTGKGVQFLRQAMQADGLNAEQATARLQQLGPGAMLADVGPNMQQLAAGLVAIPGEARGIVQGAVRSRDAAANTRITGAMDETLGPAPIPSEIDASIGEGQRALGPSYDAVLENARAVDLEPIALNLDAAIVNAKGEAKSVLRNVRDMLNVHGTDALDPDPGTLLQTRHAVDGLMESTADGNVIRVLTNARRQIDDELAAKVPGIKEVDASYAELARQREAMERGQTIFDSGRGNAVRPQELADEVSQGALPRGRQVGPSAAPVRLREGARAELDRIVGTNANDRVALQRLVKGEGDWNSQKLATVFGQDRAQRIMDVLDAERVFAETSNFVTRNSATAARQEAADMLKGGNGSSFGPREAFMAGGVSGATRSAALTSAEKVVQALVQSGRRADLASLGQTMVSPEIQQIAELLTRMRIGPAMVPAAIGDVSRAALLGPATTFAGR